jgi:glycosyltransferase involved in cell wall biosynthesis
MNVLLIANYELDQQESMRAYAALLVSGLRERGHCVHLLSPVPVVGRVGARLFPQWVGVRKWLGYVDKFVLFPWRLRKAIGKADVVHICDHSNAMYVRLVHSRGNAGGHVRTHGRPAVVTCHDLLAVRCAMGHFPGQRVSWTGRWLQRWVAGGLRSADRVVCVSEKTREDVQGVLGIEPDRLSVAGNALHWDYLPIRAEEREGILREMGLPPGRKFFLHVGANHWYKNRSAVLPIFAELRKYAEYGEAVLVMAGARWPDEFGEWLAERGLRGQAIAVENPENAQLRALYGGAEALIFPSLEEGFGWPILEAQACGCPVAVADRAPMNAVGGEAAILIDPANPAGAAAAIVRGLEDGERLRLGSLRNAERFGRGRMIEGYIDAYVKAIRQAGSSKP